MNTALITFRRLLAFALLCTPLAWAAVTFTGLSIEKVPQLSFDTRSLQADAPAPDALARSVGQGAFTLAARSPYSQGAVAYSSSNTQVATVNASTGEVTPLSVGSTVITANQVAAVPYPAASARYTLTLTGTRVSYQAWTLPERLFGAPAFELSATPPVSTPTHPSPIVYSTTTPEVVSVTPTGTVTMLKVGTATVVASQAATTTFEAGQVSASFAVTPGVLNMTWAPQSLRLGGPALDLQPPTSPNTYPAATFSYTVADTAIAEVVGNRVRALRAGSTRITARQAAAGNYLAGEVTVDLVVQPAHISITGLSDLQRVFDVLTPANNRIALQPQALLPTGSGTPAFSYSSSDTGVATLSGNLLTAVGPGTATITVSLAADTNGQHEAASASLRLTVTGADPGLSLSAQFRSMTDPLSFTPAWTSASSGAVDITVLPHPTTSDPRTVASASGSQITVLGAGTVTLRLSQAAQGVYAPAVAETTLTVTPLPLVANTLSVTDTQPLQKRVGDAAFKLNVSTNSSAPVVVSSNAPAVATVDAQDQQTIRILGPGAAVLTVSQAVNATHTGASVQVNLQVRTVPTLSVEAISKNFGDAPFPVVVTTNSAGAKTYSVADTSIASVDANGRVSLLKAGDTTLTVELAANGDFTAGSATAPLRVLPVAPGLTINAMQAYVGDAPFTPITSTASNADLVLTLLSGNNTVARVVNNQIEPLAVGSATVQVTQVAAGNYLAASATATLTVQAAPQAMPFVIVTVEPKVFGDAAFKPTVSTNSNGAQTITSSNTAVATFDPGTGNVNIVGAGQTTLSVTVAGTATYRSATGTALLTVAKRPAQLSADELLLTVGGVAKPLVLRSLSGGAISVAVDPPTVATVQGSGTSWTVTPLAAGNATITLTQTEDGYHLPDSATARVTVTAPMAASIQWAPLTSWLLDPAGTNRFTLPAPVSNSSGAFTFSSSNTQVATVSGNEVTVLAAGSTFLRATQAAADGFAATTVEVALNVQAQNSTVNMQGNLLGANLITLRYGTLPFLVQSVPSVGQGMNQGLNTSTWSVSYASTAPNVLSVSNRLASIQGIGDATINATWTDPNNPANTVLIQHPFRIIKGDPATRLNVADPLVLPFVANQLVTPSVITASDAPVRWRSEELGMVQVSDDGRSLKMLVPGVVRIYLTQAETALYEGFTTSFVLDTRLGTPVLSDFPNRTYDLNPALPEATLVPPKSDNSPAPFSYSSSDPSVGEVVAGKFVMKKPGSTVITATQASLPPYGSAEISAVYTVRSADAQLGFVELPPNLVVGRSFRLWARSLSDGFVNFALTTPNTGFVSNLLGDGYGIEVIPISAGILTVELTQDAKAGYASAKAVFSATVSDSPHLTLDSLADRRVGDAAFTPVWRGESQGAVSFTLLPDQGNNVATLSGDRITPTGVGSVIVQALQAATATHPASSAQTRLNVLGQLPTITGLPSTSTQRFPSTRQFALPAITSSNNSAPLVFSSSNPQVATVTAEGNGQAIVTLNGVGQAVLSVSQDAIGNWAASQVSMLLNVVADSAPVMTTLVDRSLSFGSPDTVLSSQIEGVTGVVTGISSSNPSVAEVLADGFTVRILGVGATTLSALQGNSVAKTATLTVVPADQTIDFLTTELKRSAGSTTVELEAVASSGLPVRFSIEPDSTPDLVFLPADSTTLQLLSNIDIGTGTVNITASQAGDSRYRPVRLTKSFSVSGASLESLAEPYSTIAVAYGDPNGAPVAAFAFDEGSVVSVSDPTIARLTQPLSDTSGAAIAGGSTLVTTVNGVEVRLQKSVYARAGNNPPRAIAMNLGTTMVWGYRSGKQVFANLYVLPGQPNIVGWDSTLALRFEQGAQALVPPASNSRGSLTYSVSPPALARVENGQIVPLQAGAGTITVTQAADGNYTSASVTRALYIQPGLINLDFGQVRRVYGDAPFTLSLPVGIRPDRPFDVSTTDANVIHVAVTGDELAINILGAGTATVTVSQSAAQSGGSNDVVAQASVLVDKAQPQLRFDMLAPAQLQQPGCGQVAPVYLPKANQGFYPAPVNGQLTFLHSQLVTRSDGGIRYRLDDRFLRFLSPNYDEATLAGMSINLLAGTQGQWFNLVVEQAESANFYGQSIVIPNAVKVYSTTNNQAVCGA